MLNHKDQGHLAVLCLIQEAAQRGFKVLRPEGDNDAFDLVLMTLEGKFLRIQVKSTVGLKPGRTTASFVLKRGGKKNLKPYTKAEVDYIAGYVMDSKTWYLIPIEALGDITQIHVNNRSRWAVYQNNWEGLK